MTDGQAEVFSCIPIYTHKKTMPYPIYALHCLHGDVESESATTAATQHLRVHHIFISCVEGLILIGEKDKGRKERTVFFGFAMGQRRRKGVKSRTQGGS